MVQDDGAKSVEGRIFVFVVLGKTRLVLVLVLVLAAWMKVQFI